MENRYRVVVSAIGVSLAAAFLMAQEPAAHHAGILHPEMKVETGTYESPAATLGVKSAQPWSATSIAAGVSQKPEPGHDVEIVGEVVDFSCYLQLGKHGEKHRACGQKCVQNGQPIGLLKADGTLYMLMPEEHDARRDGGVDARPSASDHMGQIVKVIGTETSHNGYRAVYVAGLTK